MLCSHPKSCHWCFQHHLQYTRSANKYPINSSLNSRQLNLSPVFKKCQTVQGLLKTFTNIRFEWAGANALFILSWEEDAFMRNMRRMPNAETYSPHPQWDFITGLSFFSLACVGTLATVLLLFWPDAICTLVFTVSIHTLTIYHTCIVTQLGLLKQ